MKLGELRPALARHGVSVGITAAGTLRLNAAFPPPAELLEAVREHKAALLAALGAEVPAILEALPAERPAATLYLTALTASGYPYALDWSPPTWPPTPAELAVQMLNVRAYVAESEPRTLKLFNIAPSPVVGWQLEAGPVLLARVAPDGYETLGERSTRLRLERPA